MKIAVILAAFPVVFVLLALALIISNPPIDQELLGAGNNKTLDFSSTSQQDLSPLAPLQSMKLDQASPVSYRFYENSGDKNRLIVLIHGSGWHSMQYAKTADYLAKNNFGHVVTPDLRGHGLDPERRGDIDYIGQLEDDVAHLVNMLKQKHTIDQVVIAGHSSGGGLVIRLAGGKHGGIADGWILLAPFIKYDAPTARQNSGGWAHPLVRRIIGLSMLNQIGITWFNHLTAIQFNMPKQVREAPLGDSATLAYSHRLNISYAPRSDYGSDIAKMTKPILLIAGSNDEAFRASAYEQTLAAHTTSGTYHILDGLGHIDVVDDDMTLKIISNWLGTL